MGIFKYAKFKALGGQVGGGEITTETATVTPTKSTQYVRPENATYLSRVVVNPIPDEYIRPSGNLEINDNGSEDVSEYASVTVNVDKGIHPSGDLEITENGSKDVTEYASVTVNVAGSDPVADVVMAFIAKSTATTYDDSAPFYPNVMFCLGDRGGNKGLAIIPPNVTDLGACLSAVNSNDMDSGNALVLSLPIVPPITQPIGGWASWGGNYPPEAIYVPDESVVAYKVADNWSEFADLIKPMSYLVTGVMPDEPVVTEISFDVDNATYTALPGMIWRDWVDSVYNPFRDDWQVSMNDDFEEELFYQGDPIYETNTGNQVTPTDTIINGGVYRF